MVEKKNSIREDLFKKLATLAKNGPIPTVGRGDTAVGMTLLSALGIEYTSLAKPNYYGIIITAHRRVPSGIRNRVNLFAQVPEWGLSACKSSREIAEQYGYDAGPKKRRLYCTVNSKHTNSQGLILKIDHQKGLLVETAFREGKYIPVATWKISKLKERLTESHPESVWVKAVVIERDGQEYFHYREAVHAGPPNVNRFSELIDSGTITIDHLISIEAGRVNEKGPLFKIHPSNLELLFSTPKKYDLMSLR